MAKSVDPNQMPSSAMSDLGIYVYYGRCDIALSQNCTALDMTLMGWLGHKANRIVPHVGFCFICSTRSLTAGFKLAQKFREKWLLPQDKTGRSFIGWGRSQDSVYLSPYWKRYIQDSQPTLPHCLGELTKKETNFTVDLFILTSKPIKWCKVTKI